MDLFRALARPVLFAMPPETAHRFANAALGMPLPWERVGGVPQDPRLRVRVAGLDLDNPVGLAAGFDKGCRHLDVFGRIGFGYAVGGTVTRMPRVGNPHPRIARSPRSVAIVNAMGLPNPGAEAVARSLRGRPWSAPRIVSLADEAIEDVLEAHALLEPLADAIELNVSCPNVSWGRDRDNEAHVTELLTRLGERRQKPLFVKLPPFVADVGREVVTSLARIAQEGGAEGLTCSNTREVRDRRMSTEAGGVSGGPLSDATPNIVRAVREATGGELAINACGGILGPQEALACLEAGAATVQVYTGLVYSGPAIVRRVCKGILDALDQKQVPLAGLAA